jgi:hypothetical protein
MKKIIQGMTYDTDTATFIARGDHHSELSQAWWALYRTPLGVFFEVAADHDGVVNEFRPLNDAQARAFLETNANHLVEKYFGPMPDASPLRFSRRTIIAAIELLEGAIKVHADLTRFLLKLSPDLARRCDAGALNDRFNHLIKFLDDQPDFQLEGGGRLRDELVENAVPFYSSSEEARSGAFLRALEGDGFVITEGVLRRALPAVVNLPEAQDEIFRLLAKHHFTVPTGHLDQAFVAHTDGHWASANSQIRSFLEGLLDEIAERLDPTAVTLPSGQARRARLAAIGFLSRSLNEWEDHGLGYINGLMKRLHPQGSHPGLSDQDDSAARSNAI